MAGRTPGRTYATPDPAPTALDSTTELADDGDVTPLVTPDGAFVNPGLSDLRNIGLSAGETLYETPYSPSGTVFVHDDAVVFYADGGVVGLDAASGERAWRAEFRVNVFPAGDGIGYRKSLQGADGVGRGGGMEIGVIDPETRKRRWKQQVNADNVPREYRNPVVDVDSGTLLVTDVWIDGTNPDKDKTHHLRAYDLESGEERWTNEGVTYPHAARDGRVLVDQRTARHQRSAGHDAFAALSVEDGSEEWTRTEDAFASKYGLAVDGDGVYVGSEEELIALSPVSGETEWSYRPPGASVEGVVAAADGVVLSTTDRIAVFDKDEGEERTGTEYRRGSRLAVAGGRVFVGDGGLTVLGPG